jgi:predicted alpha/beta-fold hydrolase
MTLYCALRSSQHWEQTVVDPEPPYQDHLFLGANDVPLHGWVAIPERPKGTIVGTYGITGNLENQWFLRILGRKAYAQGYAVVFFDWRAHGKSAELSPVLTSDGLYEGEDFVRIAAQAKAMGCPAPFWFTGYSLGGQLALWAVKAAQEVSVAGLDSEEIAGAAVICPSLDSNRSLSYLVSHPLGRYLEQAIARELKRLAWRLHELHPQDIDPAAVERANSIWGFDDELVIGRLGFASVEEYYEASSALHILPHLRKPTLILYAIDDPMFTPELVPELRAIAGQNRTLDVVLTPYGGHVGYLSSAASQRQLGDPDPWWAWNRMLEWCEKLG